MLGQLDASTELVFEPVLVVLENLGGLEQVEN